MPLPASYVGLNSLRGNFPVTEKTSLWSARLDQVWSNRNSSFPSCRRIAIVGHGHSIYVAEPGVRPERRLTHRFKSVARLQRYLRAQHHHRRRHHQSISIPVCSPRTPLWLLRSSRRQRYRRQHIPGFAYFGREPYSTVDRIEKRWEFTDALTHIYGHQVPSSSASTRTSLASRLLLNHRSSNSTLGATFNFGGSLFGSLPGLTAAQAYGIGIPQTYIQGIGTSSQSFSNVPFGFFAQDTWRITTQADAELRASL